MKKLKEVTGIIDDFIYELTTITTIIFMKLHDVIIIMLIL